MEKRPHNATDRQAYIDIAKGILAILVVWGHMLTGEARLSVVLIRFICSFHMPAFFIISGILINEQRLHERETGTFITRKAQHLLIPYVVFELIGGFWQMIWLGSSSVNLKGIIFGILTIHCHVGADWFLPTLFFAQIIIFLLMKYANKKNYWIHCVCFFLIAFLLPDAGHWMKILRRTLIAAGFILAGYQGKAWFSQKSKSLLLISFITTIMVTFLNGTVAIATTTFNNPLLFLLGGFAGTYWMLYLSNAVAELFKKATIPVQTVGKSSLVIMGTHQNVLVFFNALFGGWNTTWGYFAVVSITILSELFIISFCKHHLPTWVGIKGCENKNETTQQN